jgi:PKD repeat protein
MTERLLFLGFALIAWPHLQGSAAAPISEELAFTYNFGSLVTSHTYAAPGRYTATVTTTDNGSKTGSDSETFEVVTAMHFGDLDGAGTATPAPGPRRSQSPCIQPITRHSRMHVSAGCGTMARPPSARRAVMAGAPFRKIGFGKRRRACRSTSSTSNSARRRTPVARITTRMATAMDDSSLWRRNRRAT